MYTHLSEALPDLHDEVIISDGKGAYLVCYLEAWPVEDVDNGGPLYYWTNGGHEYDLEEYTYWTEIPLFSEDDLSDEEIPSNCYKQKEKETIAGYRVDGSNIVKV